MNYQVPYLSPVVPPQAFNDGMESEEQNVRGRATANQSAFERRILPNSALFQLLSFQQHHLLHWQFNQYHRMIFSCRADQMCGIKTTILTMCQLILARWTRMMRSTTVTTTMEMTTVCRQLKFLDFK